MPYSAGKFTCSKGDPLLREVWKKSKISSEARHNEKPTSVLERLDRGSREGPMGSRLQNSTKRLVTRRRTPGLKNADRVKYIVRSLFPHIQPLPRQDRSSCVVRREELFTLEAGDRPGAKRDPQRGDGGIHGDPAGSLQLLSSGGKVLRRLEEAEVGPAEGRQQTSRRCLIL